MRMRLIFSLVAVAALMTGVAAADNSLAVTPAAAMNGTSYGLELIIEDRASSTPDAAYVHAGADKGFNAETTLNGSFFIDPQLMTMAQTAGQNHFQLLYLYEDLVDSSDVKLIFFLQRAAGTGHWFITVWHWNENVGNWVFSGNGFFSLYQTAGWGPTKIEFEWTAGDPGHLNMWRTLYTGTTPGTRTQMINVDLAGMGTATINNVFVGMLNFNSQKNGTFGTLRLDEFVFTR